MIASHEPSSDTVYEPQFLPPGQPGFYLVYTDAGESAPVYWMPAGTADEAPADIQDTFAYRSAVRDPDLDNYDTRIYAKGDVVSVPVASKRSRRKASASDCWSGWTCLFSQTYLSGAIARHADEGYWQNMGYFGLNNLSSSVYNNKDNKSTQYASELDGGGSIFCNLAGGVNYTLNSFWDDNISSIKIKQNNNC